MRIPVYGEMAVFRTMVIKPADGNRQLKALGLKRIVLPLENEYDLGTTGHNPPEDAVILAGTSEV